MPTNIWKGMKNRVSGSFKNMKSWQPKYQQGGCGSYQGFNCDWYGDKGYRPIAKINMGDV